MKILILFLIYFNVNAELRDLASSSNELCFSLLKAIPAKQNVFFSPSSIYIALGMLYAGAKGSTAEEMRQILNYDEIGLNEGSIHRIFGNLINVFESESTEYKLELANALLYQENFHVLPEFKATLQNHYGALIKGIDFNDEGQAIREINNWVKENTNGNIPNFLDELPSDLALILLNAVYFKGTWLKKFDPQLTRNAMFYNNGVDKVPIQMMHIEEYFLMNWYHNKGVRALELPYKGNDISMLILLPFSHDKLDEVEQNLSDESLNEIVSNLEMNSFRLFVSIPKFKLEDSRHLKANLSHLGLNSLFNINADLTGINEDANLFVSDVLHKAMIEVNEEGSVAAAVSEIDAVPVSTFPLFYVDHPFLFFIRDRRTNMILFAGRVNNL